ncbi:hypothetical protein OSTOST_24046, partial [Ostertagia ostertagi]
MATPISSQPMNMTFRIRFQVRSCHDVIWKVTTVLNSVTTGYCWCVDRFGREFDKSRTKGELPDCGQYDDMVVDGQISVDEWCDCFSFADDLRHEPPCHKKKHSVDPHMT